MFSFTFCSFLIFIGCPSSVWLARTWLACSTLFTNRFGGVRIINTEFYNTYLVPGNIISSSINACERPPNQVKDPPASVYLATSNEAKLASLSSPTFNIDLFVHWLIDWFIDLFVGIFFNDFSRFYYLFCSWFNHFIPWWFLQSTRCPSPFPP